MAYMSPPQENGPKLNKGKFRNGIFLQDGCQTHSQLPVAGVPMSSRACPLIPDRKVSSTRQTEVRDITATLKHVAHDVCVEPHLQPVTGEQFQQCTAICDDEARFDVAASGLRSGRFRRTFYYKCGCSNHMHPQTGPPPSPPAMTSMKKKKKTIPTAHP